MPVKPVMLYSTDETCLRKPSRKVPRINKTIRDLIQDLKDTLATQPGAGLAAVQIGVHWRVTVVRFGQDTGEMGEPMALVNPEIVEQGDAVDGFDGCLSIPNVYTWATERPQWIKFRYTNEQGKPQEMRVEGIDARLVHHELDHMDGTLFLDRLQDKAELYTPIQTENGQKMVKLSDLPDMKR